LGEKVLYMRTTDLKIYTDSHYVHGMRIAMKHDDKKDPEHIENLDSFNSSETTIVADHHQRFYEHAVGSAEGKTHNVHLEWGESIRSVTLKYDDVIRHIEVTKSDGSVLSLGEVDEAWKAYQTDTINFSRGEEVVGVYGMIDKDKKTAGVANHFVSMGFITNTCENQDLQRMSHELGRSRKDGRRWGEADGDNTILVVAVVCLSVIFALTCIYCVLKKRGQICKKKGMQDA